MNDYILAILNSELIVIDRIVYDHEPTVDEIATSLTLEEKAFGTKVTSFQCWVHGDVDIDSKWIETLEKWQRPQPWDSWTLDTNYDWQPPVPKPEGNYLWNETTLSWDEIVIPSE
jgi:hypothetical protein